MGLIRIRKMADFPLCPFFDGLPPGVYEKRVSAKRNPSSKRTQTLFISVTSCSKGKCTSVGQDECEALIKGKAQTSRNV